MVSGGLGDIGLGGTRCWGSVFTSEGAADDRARRILIPCGDTQPCVYDGHVGEAKKHKDSRRRESSQVRVGEGGQSASESLVRTEKVFYTAESSTWKHSNCFVSVDCEEETTFGRTGGWLCWMDPFFLPLVIYLW